MGRQFHRNGGFCVNLGVTVAVYTIWAAALGLEVIALNGSRGRTVRPGFGAIVFASPYREVLS